MKKNKKSSKNSNHAPQAMPEAAYNINPDDVEIGDEITVKDIKKRDYTKKEDH